MLRSEDDEFWWRDDAACKESDPNLFTGAQLKSRDNRMQALEICSRCPVIQQCREWADEDLYFQGIAGAQYYGKRVI